MQARFFFKRETDNYWVYAYDNGAREHVVYLEKKAFPQISGEAIFIFNVRKSSNPQTIAELRRENQLLKKQLNEALVSLQQIKKIAEDT